MKVVPDVSSTAALGLSALHDAKSDWSRGHITYLDFQAAAVICLTGEHVLGCVRLMNPASGL